LQKIFDCIVYRIGAVRLVEPERVLNKGTCGSLARGLLLGDFKERAVWGVLDGNDVWVLCN
jgi:hypothetical protein